MKAVLAPGQAGNDTNAYPEKTPAVFFFRLWREPGAMRIGMDVNYEVMVKARNEYGLDHFCGVVGDALHLPLPNCSVDNMISSFITWSAKVNYRPPLPKGFACCGQVGS